MSKLMLIDGNSIINRAFFAIPLLTNKDGEYTNGVYGFFNIFFKFIQEENPEYVAIAFDLPKPTFRHEKFEAYKGTRKTMADELRPQLPLLKSILKQMNIAIFELEGYEADDILGTMAKEAEKENLDVTLISGDRDLLQIASDKIKIRIPKTKGGKTEVEDYYGKDVIELFGVTPTEYIDVKALMGDASDNIPGVPSIGEKTAFKIIMEYKTIENAIENYEKVLPKKASQNLLEHKEQAIMSKELATIHTAVPLEYDLKSIEFNPKEVYNPEAYETFKKMEFKSFYSYFTKEMETQINEVPKKQLDNTLVADKKEIINIISLANKQNLVSYKIIYEDNIIKGISLAFMDKCYYLSSKMLDTNGFVELCKPLFESYTEKVTLDLKKDIVELNKYGININNGNFDVMIGCYILNASKSSYNYNDVALEVLNEVYPSSEDFFGKGRAKQQLELFDNDDMCDFACVQADVINRAYPVIKERLKEYEQENVYYDIEYPLIFVLADMEICGVKVDEAALIEYGKKIDARLEILTSNIYGYAEEEFNINSPKQLGVILFEKLNLPFGKKTKTGYSTSVDILEKLLDKHDIIADIMEYRTYSKLKSTYVDGLLNVIDRKTGKIYSTFNQTIATTGRISSTEPNLQNIPIRMEIGRELRKIFIPTDESYLFADADYSQIELRILAAMSGDETFINAFNENQDIHRLTASQVFKIPFDEVTSNQRSNAKAVNFGIVYGIGAFSLSQDLGITQKEAARYIDGYFEKYSSVKTYLDGTIEQARKDGYAKTIFNRKRNIPEINASNFIQRSFGERVAMNMPIQGTAADIIKIAMIKVYNRLKSENLKSRIVLQVHDELLLEVKLDEVDKVVPLLKEEMENAVKLKVKIEADVKCGKNWFDVH